MPQELRNLVGVAPSGFGCPLCASAPPGRGLEVDKGGGFAEPGAWRGAWAGSPFIHEARFSCYACYSSLISWNPWPLKLDPRLPE